MPANGPKQLNILNYDDTKYVFKRNQLLQGLKKTKTIDHYKEKSIKAHCPLI